MNKEEKKLIPELRFPEFVGDGEWRATTLDKLCDIIKGEQLNRIDLTEVGKYPCQNGGINPSGYTDKFNAEENTITISEGGNSCGYVNFIHSKFWLGGHCYKLSVNTNDNKLFLYYLLKFNEEQIMKLRVGSGLPNIQQKALRNFGFLICNSIMEQQKIASCLSSLDDLLKLHTDKLENLKHHKKGLMQNLFPQQDEKVPKLRFEEFEDNGEWLEKRLDKVAEIVTGNTPSTIETQYYNGANLFVSPGDMNDYRYVTQTKTTLSDLGFSRARMIKENSVLFVCIGSTIGKIAQNSKECATNQQINSLIAYSGYSNDFLYSILEFNAARIAGMAGNHAVPLINKSSFSAIELSFPPTLEEQQKIANTLSSLDTLIKEQTEKIEQLKLHKKGLMQRLFPKIKN